MKSPTEENAEEERTARGDEPAEVTVAEEDIVKECTTETGNTIEKEVAKKSAEKIESAEESSADNILAETVREAEKMTAATVEMKISEKI